MSVFNSKTTYAMQKHRIIEALNPHTIALDYQIVRNIIITTHQLQEGVSLWDARQSLNMKEVNTAWKFCLMLHKVLLHGHEEVCELAKQNIEELKRIHSLWAQEHNEHNLMQRIPLYYQALLLKIQFHKTYAFLNCDMSLKAPKDWETDLCFQLTVDIFDLLDIFLALGYCLRNDIKTQTMSRKSERTICPLTTVLTILGECKALYRLAVFALTQLECALMPADVAGLKYRFEIIYTKFQQWCCYLRELNVPLEIDCNNFEVQKYQQKTCAPSAPLENELEF